MRKYDIYIYIYIYIYMIYKLSCKDVALIKLNTILIDVKNKSVVFGCARYMIVNYINLLNSPLLTRSVLRDVNLVSETYRPVYNVGYPN